MPKTFQSFKHTTSLVRSSKLCSPRLDNRVSPLCGDYPGYHILEIRPGRTLCVLHLNPSSLESVVGHGLDSDCVKRLIQLHEKQYSQQQHQQQKAACQGMGESSDSNEFHSFQNVLGSRTPITSSTLLKSTTEVAMREQNSTKASSEREMLCLEGSENEPKAHCGAALFLIHGVAGSSDVWQAQIDFFSQQGFEMIIPDLLGHGKSSAPADPKAYSFAEISEDLLAVFDKFCKRCNVIIGHSYG